MTAPDHSTPTVILASRVEVAPPSVAPAVGGDRTRRLLEGPILVTLLRLAAPNVTVMVLLAVAGTIDAIFVSGLGADAIAGVSLVYPLAMLMTTMSAGGMGGAVASSIARALGAGRRSEADALLAHALVIAVVLGSVFSAGLLLAGPSLYAAMGGRGATLAAALAYSNVVFAGAVVTWLVNTLASALRGGGQMAVPAVVTIGGEAGHLLLAPMLIFGLGPLPRLEVAGAGWSLVISLAMRAVILLAFLYAGRGPVGFPRSWPVLRRAHFWEILRVGLPGSLHTVLTNLNVIVLTSLAAGFGTATLAGYGLGARLEYLLIPLTFGIGAALVTMVGANIGAGQRARAQRVAWTGAGVAATITGSIGLIAALAPELWMGLFSREPAVVAAGVAFLRLVGPTYACFGLGLSLYFASQGAGRLAGPLAVGFGRFLIGVGGGWLAITWLGAGPTGLFVAIALAFLVYGLSMALAVRWSGWR